MTDSVRVDQLTWRKSTYSLDGACVEMAKAPDGGVAVRNSNNRDAGMIVFDEAEIRAFLLGVKAGEFDDLV